MTPLSDGIPMHIRVCFRLIFFETTPCPRKKQATIIFHINFAICWDIFTIFEATCSGIIAGWCNLLHTHHQCQAFTWRDVTHDVIQAVARRAHRHQISYHLTYGRSPDLNPVHYSFWSIMQEKVCEYRWVETSPSSGVGGAGPQTYRCSYRTAATPSQCVWLVCESSGGYFDQHLHWIYM